MAFWTAIFGSFIDQIADFAIEQYEEAKIANAIGDAISSMSGLPVNAGQEAIFQDYIEPAFLSISTDPDNCNPEQVYGDIPGEYLDFMGGIVEEGIDIINQALEEIQARREDS
jgi:hypothetical protein